MTFVQPSSPVAGSLFLSALAGMLPLVTIFVLLGAVRAKAHFAALSALAVALLVSVLAFGMPLRLAVLSGTEGGVFGLFPIMWIVLCAIWLYQLTVVSGRFEDLRGAFRLISDDSRIQAVIIAFCFGSLLEALAGFGAPIAITGVMLMALGFSAMRAATVVLLANTAPVAFGAIATPIITAGALTGIDYHHIGAYVAVQTPVFALVVPLLLVILVDGRRGLRQTWPFALTVGTVFSVAKFISARYISVELTDVIASLAGMLTAVVMLRFWQPAGTMEANETLRVEHELELKELALATASAGPGSAGSAGSAVVTGPAPDALGEQSVLSPSRIAMSLVPYLVVIAVFSVTQLWTPFKHSLAGTDLKINWPGLNGHVLNHAGKPISSTIYNFTWLSSPGTLLLFCGIIVALIYRVTPAAAVQEFGKVLFKMRFTLLTVGSLLGVAYVMNQSGQTIAIGTWIASAGAGFAFLSPILGWLGTAVTGSDTSANALFSTLQQTVGQKTGIDPSLLVAANTSGGVLGKMISPQNLTIAATAVGLPGRESALFRKIAPWSLGMLLAMCVLVYLQSTPVLSWMLG